FDNDWCNDGQLHRAGPVRGSCPRTGYDDGAIGYDERRARGRAVDRLVDEIEHGSTACEDDTGSKHRTTANDRSFVDTAVSANNDVVLDDDWRSVDGFEYAAKLRRGAHVNALTHLRAGSDQRV